VKLLLARVGKGRTRWADLATEDYSRRLPRHLGYAEELLRPETFRGDENAVRTAEGDRIRSVIRGGDRLVLLEERGKLATTQELAGWLDEAAHLGTRRVVFAIGGPYGHDPTLRREAWKQLALSGMVLNHELARVVLVEQIYRVSTLLWGGAYHH
jgi:23S rRNA (pseudouridine1915-N3)-methyltransferase